MATDSGLLNPYTKFYSDNAGHIIGRPVCFSPSADPRQRVFQETMLRNNTILTLVPGIPKFNKDLDKANTIFKEHAEKAKVIDDKYLGKNANEVNNTQYEIEMSRLNRESQSKLISAGIDMRQVHFEYAAALYKERVQFLYNTISTLLIGESTVSALSNLTATSRTNENVALRGFNFWCEKGTSISEGIDNQYSNSVMEKLSDGLRSISKEFQHIKGTVFGESNDENTPEIQSFDADKAVSGFLAQNGGKLITGTKLLFAQFWEDGKFTRNYDVAFKFVSPYGDNLSVFYHVFYPFICLLALALPTQDGPSGIKSPFLVQADCPGYFSCPMGAITGMQFKKGGDDALFNDNGLPLVIEGTITITDLYSALSLPTRYGELLVNAGTSAFLTNLAGLPIYTSEDPSIRTSLLSKFKDIPTGAMRIVNEVDQKVGAVKRYFGFTGP